MDLFTLIGVVSVLYLMLLFFDSIFKSCMHHPYDSFLRNTGLSIKFFRLEWKTTVFNRLIIKWRYVCPRILSKSFDIGVYVTLIILPTVTFLLFLSVFYTPEKNTVLGDNLKLQVVLPFVTLPIDEVPYYIFALIVCSVTHELGHAIAAVSFKFPLQNFDFYVFLFTQALEDVPTRAFGIHLIFFLPIAFTEVDYEYMSALRIWKRLKVLCAGIWHNILVGLLCYLILASVPQLASSFYNINDSVIVTSIKPRSPVSAGTKGLHVHDIITHINDCKVKNIRTWYNCLQEAIQYQPTYCLSTDFVRANDESVLVSHNNQIIDCCDPNNKKAICFEHILEKFDDDTELPQYMCLDIRNTIEYSDGYCNKKHRCKSGQCFKPVMDNSTTIMQVQRWYQTDMIYVGHSNDFSRNVKVSEFVPKTTFLSPHVADCISLMLKYLIVFSFGLASINALPCYGFDGQHLVHALLHNFKNPRYPNDKHRKDMIALGVNTFGTILLFILVTKALWMSLLSHLW
uniref:Membrane-bound transcription factor site-2 protease n=1 Tax=Culicoides sonorensis TaxID=179676 RepID=A0A336M4L4_CULSO